MSTFDVIRKLAKGPEGKIVLVVMDGVGGLARTPGGPTELEAASTPNLDALATEGTCGLLDNVAPGLTPGSGPAHLGLFGYDPLVYDIGRGLLSALGVAFPIEPGDLAARINFCTIDPASGFVTDRRAGRIPTETSTKLVEILNTITLPGCEVFVRPVKEHRACVVFRAPDLYDDLNDTDPQTVNEDPPHPVVAEDPKSEKAAALVTQFIEQAMALLADHAPANGLLLRGFARYEKLPLLPEVYGMRCAAIANYPMYKGVASLVGMDVLADAGDTLEEEFDCIEKHFDEYDFFFMHVKKTDSYGEDGNWDAKVHVIEELDALLPRLRALNPMVIAVTADHSTPAVLKAHSWHPVPVALAGPLARKDAVQRFTEAACACGGLGRMRGISLMPILAAHALGLEKYGA